MIKLINFREGIITKITHKSHTAYIIIRKKEQFHTNKPMNIKKKTKKI